MRERKHLCLFLFPPIFLWKLHPRKGSQSSTLCHWLNRSYFPSVAITFFRRSFSLFILLVVMVVVAVNYSGRRLYGSAPNGLQQIKTPFYFAFWWMQSSGTDMTVEMSCTEVTGMSAVRCSSKRAHFVRFENELFVVVHAHALNCVTNLGAARLESKELLRVYPKHRDEVAEWLRRWTANPMCSARVGSNPILVELFDPFRSRQNCSSSLSSLSVLLYR